MHFLTADPGVDTPVDPAAGPAAGLPAYPAVVTPPNVLAADPGAPTTATTSFTATPAASAKNPLLHFPQSFSQLSVPRSLPLLPILSGANSLVFGVRALSRQLSHLQPLLLPTPLLPYSLLTPPLSYLWSPQLQSYPGSDPAVLPGSLNWP
jgi:hypothetical protein